MTAKMNALKKNILVVSNEPELPELLGEHLSSNGYRITGTEDSGVSLLDVINKVTPDLVIVGMAVSCIEAVELCLRIRKWCATPILLVRGWENTGQSADVLERPRRVVRPNTIQQLKSRIETAFSRN
jgi:two-component system KDP operon response regulator KdpE